VGVAPFSINPMMLTHGGATATGVLVKGVDPKLSIGVDNGEDEWQGKYDHFKPVLDLPGYIIAGKIDNLRKPGARPAESKFRVPPELPPVPVLPETHDAKDALGKSIDDAADATTGKSTPSAGPAASIEPVDSQPKPDPGTFLGGGDENDSHVDPDLEPLPDEDTLPPDVDPDPCGDTEAVASMPGIIVGQSLAKTLKLAHTAKPNGDPAWSLGDCVTVTSPTIGFSFSSGKIKPPVAKRFRVIAVFEAGFDQYDSKLVYTDLYEAQTFYDHGDTVTGVEMKVGDIDAAGEIADEIAGILASGLYHTMDWEELNHGLFTALRIQQVGMSAVLALIIVVAAFTVIATLIMVVLDKQKEISALKSMGARDAAVLRMFLYQGGLIGLIGTTLGLVLGYAVCKGLLVYGFPLDPEVYFIDRLPVQLRIYEFAITGFIAVLICTLATIIPSMYAANLRPADGFRNQ